MSFFCSGKQNTYLDVDWRQPKPKMHMPCQNDPAPDSQVFRDHVICEHNGLALNISARTRISQRVRESFLRSNSVFMVPRLSRCSRHSFHHGSPCLMLSGHVLYVSQLQRPPARIKGSYARRRRKKRWAIDRFVVTCITC